MEHAEHADAEQAAPAAAVTRTVETEADTTDVWHVLTDDDARSAWMGGDSRIDVRPGGSGRVVEPDGAVHDVEVDTVEPERRLVWRWWPRAGGPTSQVEFVVEPRPRGARLIVTERLVTVGDATACVATIGDRTLDLELYLLALVRV